MDIGNETGQDPELQVWALEHFRMMADKAIWRPEGTGLRYRKDGETTLVLEQRVNHPQAEAHHEQLKELYASVSITVLDDEVMLTDPSLSAEEAFRKEVQERQMIASAWKCECDMLLKDMELFLGVPTFMGEREVLFDDGETRTIEDWGVAIECNSCSKIITMNPDDYNLLAGDDLFMRYKCDKDHYMIALSRQQMYDMAEANELGILVGATCPESGDKVPPWMWGTYCKRVSVEELNFDVALLEEE